MEPKYTLYPGDCLEIMRQIPDRSVDLVLCDPPYGTTAATWDKTLDFAAVWLEYKRIVRDRGAMVLFGVQPFTSLLITSNLSGYRYSWVWDKSLPTGFLNAKIQPMRQTEDIVVFGFDSPVYYPIMTPRHKKRMSNERKTGKGSTLYNSSFGGGDIPREYLDRYPTNILFFPAGNERGEYHPTQKPLPLLEYLIKTYTQPGETVLDNTCGSGSTLVAALRTGRAAIGIEKDPYWFEVATNRLQKAEVDLNPFSQWEAQP